MKSKAPCEPPLEDMYQALFKTNSIRRCLQDKGHEVMEQLELPLVDLSMLRTKVKTDGRDSCISAIVRASSEWGFFQVLNHGISHSLLVEMIREQKRLFAMPFEKKMSSKLLNGSYRCGSPTSRSCEQFSWSEAFHVPLGKISEKDYCSLEFSSPRDVMEKLAKAMSELALMLAEVLAENLGHPGDPFAENCSWSTCYLRLNHYPPCPFSPETFGLIPHTDTDFLTILYQDQVGGLQLRKESKWVAVKPNPDALIVNIGDLFQAWSNNFYKSVEHKVMTNGEMERYSVAYFLCPSEESIIGSCREPSLYKKFTFGEFRRQVEEDVKRTGVKVGLARFLL